MLWRRDVENRDIELDLVAGGAELQCEMFL